MTAIHDHIRLAFHTLSAAGAMYLYLQVLGAGLTGLLFGRRIVSYQVWLAPWFGLMLAVIPLFCLSRLGVSMERAFWVMTMTGASLAVLCLVKRKPLFVKLRSFDGWLAAGAVATLAIALCPQFSLSDAPTTISLGNNDPALYAAAADYLRLHSIARLPAPDAMRPVTVLVGSLLSPGHRPGAFLILSLFACLLHAPSYRIFSVFLAVLLALTTPLLTIFAHLVTGRRACGRVALALSAANVNFIYCYYHGFAAQILVLGCIIAAFIMVLLNAREKSPRVSDAITIGFAMIAMIMLVPEGAVFFIVPYLLFAAVQWLSGACSPLQLMERYGPALAVVLIVGMFPLWQGARWLHHISTLQFGWEIPHWALPIHLIGLMSAVGATRHSMVFTVGLSVPIVAAICWGIARARQRLPMAVLVGFNFAVLFYFGALRHYSYAYYKAGVMSGFIFIAAFSAGLPAQLYKQLSATCAVLAVLSFIICRPTISAMMRPPLAVTPELSALSTIPPRIIRSEVISLDQLKLWDRLWAAELMPGAALTAHETFFSWRTATSILLAHGVRGRTPQAWAAADILWANDRYLLIKAGNRAVSSRP